LKENKKQQKKPPQQNNLIFDKKKKKKKKNLALVKTYPLKVKWSTPYHSDPTPS
jgi:hypothetical protein